MEETLLEQFAVATYNSNQELPNVTNFISVCVTYLLIYSHPCSLVSRSVDGMLQLFYSPMRKFTIRRKLFI